MPRSLLLTQAVYRHGSNLDPETQLTIGAQNGLRGYAVNQWVGTRSLLLASEARLFVADEVLQLFSFALAAFADAGYAWPSRHAVALRDLRATRAWVVMVGRNRLAGRPLRIDLAYAFNPPPGRSRWQVSMGVQVELRGLTAPPQRHTYRLECTWRLMKTAASDLPTRLAAMAITRSVSSSSSASR